VALRSPPPGDLYEELGVEPDATREELAAAYRARAKQLHPDARPDEREAAERFTRLGAAYRVLADPESRARYDESQRPLAPAGSAPSVASETVPTTVTPTRPRRLSRRGARWCAWGGAALIVLGTVVGAFVFSLQRHEADLRANGVAVVATVVVVDSERRLQFETTNGDVVRAAESIKTGEEQPAPGSRVRIHYDRDDPTRIVTDESHAGRDVTLWIVAVKLTVGGAVLLGFGIHHLRRTGRRAS
jgi:hypothetical protein